VLNPLVIAFAAALGLVTAIVFSLAPALNANHDVLGSTLKEVGTRGSTARAQGLRGGLLAVQVGLAVVVLAGAGLLMKSMWRVVAVDPGLDPRNVLVLRMALPQADAYGPPERPAFCADVERQVGALPGVASVAAI